MIVGTLGDIACCSPKPLLLLLFLFLFPLFLPLLLFLLFFILSSLSPSLPLPPRSQREPPFLSSPLHWDVAVWLNLSQGTASRNEHMLFLANDVWKQHVPLTLPSSHSPSAGCMPITRPSPAQELIGPHNKKRWDSQIPTWRKSTYSSRTSVWGYS